MEKWSEFLDVDRNVNGNRLSINVKRNKTNNTRVYRNPMTVNISAPLNT